jgi:alkanesulfonate monooxygenase SsuD/methylene tetrahydromethanopterin reductase-like flavin-dependent oxidoreductase (luciferase family)
LDIGIGLPVAIPGAKADIVAEWARKAEAASFSSLGLIDRIVYPNYEALISLAFAAGATTRIRLMTTILIAPIRNTGILAKQAATLDALSGGRLTLGLAVGVREDDFLAAPASFKDRGKRFDEQLATMKRVWAGESLGDGVGPIGPPPARSGGPELLIGAFAPQAIARVGRWADGFISGGGGSDRARQGYTVAEESWKAAGRQGRPRFVVGTHAALGPDAREKSTEYIMDYYTFMGPMADAMAQSIPVTSDAIKGTIKGFEDVGVDELILWPCTAELGQVDRLADAVG